MAAEAEAERQRRRMRLRQMPGLEGLFLRTLDALGINVDDDSSVRGVVACAAIVLFFLFMVVMSE
jgi:GAF domain-containing protein